VFAQPTINDFLALIDWHIAKAVDRGERAVAQIRAEGTRSGQTGRTISLSIDAVRKEFEAGIDAVLGELKRAIRKTTLDRDELRQYAVQRLMQFATTAQAITQMDQFRRQSEGINKYIDEQFLSFNQHLQFAIRQFDVGLLDPPEPEVPVLASNSINIGNMTGSTIQQGSPGAQQRVEFKLNIDAAARALTAFELALSAAPLPLKMLDELMPDVKTIRAQLSKPSPTVSIIQEAGKSIRNVFEGIAAGMLTPEVLAAAPALWSALGLG
jgi:hypothetical protein